MMNALLIICCTNGSMNNKYGAMLLLLEPALVSPPIVRMAKWQPEGTAGTAPDGPNYNDYLRNKTNS